MTQDNGARALEGRLAVVYGNGDGPPLRDHEYGAAAVLANGAAFLPDAAELDRLRGFVQDVIDWADVPEDLRRHARAALAPEGSAGT